MHSQDKKISTRCNVTVNLGIIEDDGSRIHANCKHTFTFYNISTSRTGHFKLSLYMYFNYRKKRNIDNINKSWEVSMFKAILISTFHIFTRHLVCLNSTSFVVLRFLVFLTRLRLREGIRAKKRRALKVVKSISFRFLLDLCFSVSSLSSRFCFASGMRFILYHSVSEARNNLGRRQDLTRILIKLASFNYSAIDSRAI